MTTPDQVHELVRQARERVHTVELLRTEHRLIEAQTLRRLRESRALLDRARVRTDELVRRAL